MFVRTRQNDYYGGCLDVMHRFAIAPYEGGALPICTRIRDESDIGEVMVDKLAEATLDLETMGTQKRTLF